MLLYFLGKEFYFERLIFGTFSRNVNLVKTFSSNGISLTSQDCIAFFVVLMNRCVRSVARGEGTCSASNVGETRSPCA